jgi:hypothetical protein
MAAQCLLHLGVVIALRVSSPLPQDVPLFNGGDPCALACDHVADAEDAAAAATKEIGECGAGSHWTHSPGRNPTLVPADDPIAPHSDNCFVKMVRFDVAAIAMQKAVAELYESCKASPHYMNCQKPISPAIPGPPGDTCAPRARFAIPAG